MITEEKIEELVDDKVLLQFTTCRKDYYKTMLRIMIASVSTLFLTLSGIIVWSYKPISDIEVLKREVVIINKKLDEALDIKKSEKKSKKTDVKSIGTITTASK